MELLLSKAYEVVTEESAAEGDVAESGFEYENRTLDVRAVVRRLSECSDLSSYPVTAVTCAHTWAIVEPQMDYRTGEETSYAYFIKHLDGRRLTSRQLYRLYRLAGLTK